MNKKDLDTLSVKELESLSYKLTVERQKAAVKAKLVQQILSEKIEAERIEKILGKPQIIAPAGVDETVED